MELDHPREAAALDLIESSEVPQKRAKTPMRLLYAAEVSVFKAQHGGLENIRLKLGFSRRKICQLLMVDPSAWTRWMKDEDSIPPHVYRSLEWYLALHEKVLTNPDLAVIFTHRYKGEQKQTEDSVLLMRGQVESLEKNLKIQQNITSFLVLISMLLIGGLTFLLLR
jgi:transcriptional regulator with XRE-family HTH domain